MLSKLSVKKPYTVVVGVILLIVLGVVSFGKLTVDLLPGIELPYAVIMTTYQGASPEEIETVVTKPVEQSMATVSGIKKIQSVSADNVSTVVLEFGQSVNMDSATIDMRETLDQIKGFWPEEVKSPIIVKLNPDMLPVLVIASSVKGGEAEDTSRQIEEKVLPEVESIEGVASVTVTGNISEEVRVLLDEKAVREKSEKLKAELQKKVDEASQALDAAKQEIEAGKSSLEVGKAQAAEGISQAESEFSVKEEELKQAQLEIVGKRAQIELSKAELEKAKAEITSGKMEAQAQLLRLDPASADYEQQKMQIEALITQLTAAEEETKVKQEALDQAFSEVEKVSGQLDDGAMSLAEARGQLASAQLEAAIGLGEAASQLAAGESAIKIQEGQLEAAKENNTIDTTELLSAETIKMILTAQNFRMPAGYVTRDDEDILVRIGDKYKSIEELENTMLVDMEGLPPVRLSDIAVVEKTNNADQTYAKINGNPGVVLSIQKQSGYSTRDVSKRVLEKLEEVKKDYPEIENTTLMDQGVYINMVVNSVLQNLVYGGVLAILVLLLFLKNIKPTIVIAFSIPISIMTALLAMYFSGVTLNIISLSGLALGVGMLVDNSIVVIENIFRMRNEEGYSAKKAAVEGARQVSGAILASTLTTICVFFPIVFTQGITRQLFVDMGLTIGYSLLASLFVALTLVPMMSAGLLKNVREKKSAIIEKVQNLYGRILAWALRWKLLVIVSAILLFAGSFVLELSRGTEFIPQMESTQISMTLELPPKSSLSESAAEADKLTDILMGIDDIEEVGAIVSTSDFFGSQIQENVISFYAITKEKPEQNNEQLKQEIENRTKEINGEVSVQMSQMDMSALGNTGIVIQISGKDLDKLLEIGREVKKITENVEGTVNVSDGTEDNKQELRVLVNKEKATEKGLTVATVYQEISQRISGAKPVTTLSESVKDYDVYIEKSGSKEYNEEDIRNMVLSVKKQDGTKEDVKLSDVATFENTQTYQAVYRVNQKRYVNVTADIKDGDNIGLVSDRIKSDLKSYAVPEGYEIEMEGEDKTIREAMTELLKMLALALLFMYLIMVAQFQSLRSPFIIMFTVPLAFTGGLFALWMCRMSISVIAMIGFVMLSGIIVNNGIVLIDYTNQLIRGGMTQKEALVCAGKTRLRPIVMTALTTILGLSVMAAGVGMGAGMVQPMAVVSIGGLLYGTLLTLVVIPCVFDLFHKKERARLQEEIGDEEEGVY